jgi:hypothetical protein
VVFERVDRANTDAISGIHHETSVAQKLDICKQINREIPFLCPLKRAVPCGFESMASTGILILPRRNFAEPLN